ncbi:hypothetical protein SAY86_009630 [Trapa natans]|uniref:Uncharacterized protein n=1 Tax=Trapa natans TaxID=22666 RepID=A0AAN7QT66_TRANT|nr:hypothetical protein SAY86_009630 [Trapa natans]
MTVGQNSILSEIGHHQRMKYRKNPIQLRKSPRALCSFPLGSWHLPSFLPFLVEIMAINGWQLVCLSLLVEVKPVLNLNHETGSQLGSTRHHHTMP